MLQRDLQRQSREASRLPLDNSPPKRRSISQENFRTILLAIGVVLFITLIHTNTAENFFSVFKRGVVGTYHHISEQHLDRYLAEFDFRYNNRVGLGVNDAARSKKLLKGIVGKRLTYRRPDEAAHA
jgi:hypothetical protein